MTLLLLLACGEAEPEGSLEGDCTDGEDNDLDGEIDCDDAGCSDDPECDGTAWVLYINEFMASNETTVATDGGDYSDWIEIYNPNASEVDLGGWTITDSLNAPAKHILTSGLIVPADGFLLLWADDDEEDEGPGHLGFHLSVDGESLGLYRPDGTPADTLDFDVQAPDVSAARIPDGSTSWVLTDEPTPGESNGE